MPKREKMPDPYETNLTRRGAENANPMLSIDRDHVDMMSQAGIGEMDECETGRVNGTDLRA